MSLLKVKNLSIGYQSPLVENINLNVDKGKLIFLLGENGSGKSTFMKTLFRIIPSLSGEILYENQNILEMNPKLWSEKLSAVFSRLGIIPMIPVREIIEIGSHNVDPGWREKVVSFLNIEHLLDKLSNEISDGQLQKVMIARALLQNTDFVLFDEPTAHLDFKNKAQVFSLLRSLVDSTEKSFIVISHEILYALEIADEIWYIDKGKLFTGNPQQIDEKFKLKEQILKFKNHEI